MNGHEALGVIIDRASDVLLEQGDEAEYAFLKALYDGVEKQLYAGHPQRMLRDYERRHPGGSAGQILHQMGEQYSRGARSVIDRQRREIAELTATLQAHRKPQDEPETTLD